MSDEDKKKYLTKKGWHTWYNNNYWVNPKLVSDPKSQDYTNYGMDLESAVFHEKNKMGKFKPYGLPQLSMMMKAREHLEKIKRHFK